MADNDGVEVTGIYEGSETAPSTQAAPGRLPQRIGRYRVEKLLGMGGFGLVYLAQDEQLSRSVAIKVPHASLLSRPEDAEEYVGEARTVANLDHPTIVPVYDVGSTDDFPCFIVSKYIEGENLATTLRTSRLSHSQAAELVAKVAEALDHAHTQGLVHRDIKPENILLGKNGKPFVVDFGLAIREQDVEKRPGFFGTPSYMSPEQARGEGHRVDGRSDIFSLGVMFYELLVGRRPFRADTTMELLDQIITREARPLRQSDNTIPRELERICLKMLSKRATERYPTAQAVADDLRHFLHENPSVAGSSSAAIPLGQRTLAATSFGGDTLAPTLGSGGGFIKIVPKGLRSFDEHDADFFLEMLPGPRDRDGLPDSIRFWKTRIEETDADKTFAVGLIYGPSGCGKSSLVKAGLLPRLSADVISVYVEATADENLSRLLKGLRKGCPTLPDNMSLKETLAVLRRGQALPVGKKVLIVIDQFEQWLHAKKDDDNTELVHALRQCDGGHVQCIVMVRDDFWLAVSRFLRELEIPLVEGHNIALADLFDVDHARKILAAFGRAFGRLPESTSDISKEQKDFVRDAVTGLAEEGKVISVRLALFAEMMKGKPWTPAALREVGGTKGVAATFLEETLRASSASPEHRLHQQAGRAVLKALLPESGTDIKGNMRSYDELLCASGYANRPKDFEDLIRILDSEIRLITPTDPEGAAHENAPSHVQAGQKFYQLTHDYLVPSLRDWLTRKEKETRRGRAELRLSERSALWNAKPENRRLPFLWEFLNIRLLTNGKNWTESQRKMMRKAGRLYGIRAGLNSLAVAVVIAAGFYVRSQFEDRHNRNYASALVHSLVAANTADVEGLIEKLGSYRQWAIPLLRVMVTSNESGPKQKLHASLALVKDDPAQADYLFERLLTARAEEIPVIVRFLLPYKGQLDKQLWQTVNSGTGDQRIRAAAALAKYDPNDNAWHQINFDVVTALVSVPTVELKQWLDMLRPVGTQLAEPLEVRYRDRSSNRDAERPTVAVALSNYLNGDPQKLAELILLADNDREFLPLLLALGPHQKSASPELRGLLSQSPPDGKPDIRDAFWERQANAAVCLLELGEREAVWPLLKQTPNPSLRSFIIDRLAHLGADFGSLADDHLVLERDPSTLQAVILAIGEFDASKLSDQQRQSMVEQLTTLYRTNPEPGIHSAAAWTLRQWQKEDIVMELDAALRSAPSQDQRNWFVNSQGQSFAVVNGPVEFRMGDEPAQKHVTLTHRFAIAANEVTVSQFQQFIKDHKFDATSATQANCPVNMVTWYDAAAYCNWLSQQEGISKEQWCYEPNDHGDYAEGMKIPAKLLQRTGYRLPTEAEWEYVCRAGTTSAYSFGEPVELLNRYAWFNANSQNRMWPVGLLRPNGLGLFDTHGNAWEWCSDLADSKSADEVDVMVKNQERRVLRGGAFSVRPTAVRSANRTNDQPDHRLVNVGFRPARTYP